MANKKRKRTTRRRTHPARGNSTPKKSRKQVKRGKNARIPNRKRISKGTRKSGRKIPPHKKSGRNKKQAKKTLPIKRKSTRSKKSGRKILRKKSFTYRGAKKTRLEFLDSHNVPHEAYILDHRVKMVEGEMVVGINGETLRRITNDFRKSFRRGVQLARLFINYTLSRGRGKARLNKTVSTPRMGIMEKDSYQDLLRAFNELVLHLYEFGSEQMDDPDSSKFRIHVTNVVIELLQVDTGDTVS